MLTARKLYGDTPREQMPAEVRRFWASDAETVLAPTRKASFQESNSLLQAKSFFGVSSNLFVQTFRVRSCVYIPTKGFALLFKSSLKAYEVDMHGAPPPGLDRMSLWLYFFLLSN